jgi:hypothetical protein
MLQKTCPPEADQPHMEFEFCQPNSIALFCPKKPSLFPELLILSHPAMVKWVILFRRLTPKPT